MWYPWFIKVVLCSIALLCSSGGLGVGWPIIINTSMWWAEWCSSPTIAEDEGHHRVVGAWGVAQLFKTVNQVSSLENDENRGEGDWLLFPLFCQHWAANGHPLNTIGAVCNRAVMCDIPDKSHYLIAWVGVRWLCHLKKDLDIECKDGANSV